MGSIDVDAVDAVDGASGDGLDEYDGIAFYNYALALDGSIFVRQQTTSLKLAEGREHETISIGDENDNDTPNGIIGDQSILSRNRSLRYQASSSTTRHMTNVNGKTNTNTESLPSARSRKRSNTPTMTSTCGENLTPSWLFNKVKELCVKYEAQMKEKHLKRLATAPNKYEKKKEIIDTEWKPTSTDDAKATCVEVQKNGIGKKKGAESVIANQLFSIVGDGIDK